MRRFAHLLVDLVGRHGLSAQADATFTGRSGTTHTLPLALPSGPALVLVDGDLNGAPVDNLSLNALVAACHDLGATGLFVHTGPLTPAALHAAGDRVRLWSSDALATTLGQTVLAEALGQPLPALPFATAPTRAVHTAESTAPPTATATDEPVTPSASLAILAAEAEAEQAREATWLISEPIDSDAQTDTQAPALEIDLPDSPAALVIELTDLEPAPAQAPTAPIPGLDYIELADHTPVLHLEEADATVAEVEPAPAHATEAPDIVPLTEAQPSLATQPTPLADPAEFAVAPLTDLLPAAFRDAEPTPDPAPTPETPLLPLGFQADAAAATEAGERLTAPEGSRGLLPPRVTLEEAKASVADRLFAIEEAELILQPVHLFDYAVDLLQPGKLTAAPVTGRLQVNGTDRRVTATDSARTDAKLAHRVFANDGLTLMDKVLRVGPERAEQLATAWALEQHAKTVNVTTDRADDSFLVIERKSIAPTSGQVRLTPLGLWHRPFWRLWGDNGHVDLDAVEGHVIDEELKTPNPDFLVVE